MGWGGVFLFVCLIIFSLFEGCGPKPVNSLMGTSSGDFQSTLAANVDSQD